MASKFIVIEGLDGCGKATQTEILCQKLKDMGKKVSKLTFPVYESPSSSLVKMYLNGDFGENAKDVNPYIASSFYAVDRVASFLQSWKSDYENQDFIIADRYTTSNIIYQMAKIEEQNKKDYIDWLYDFEYNKLGIPKPDIVIYLDVNPDISQKLMSKRYNGDENKKDIHEKDVDFLLTCRKSALLAAEKLDWKVVDCCGENDILPIECISEKIFDIINNTVNI